ncbi:MAG: Ig-like domain-containing protein [Nitrospirae bacterium]|nr:Ig-like domain-containing protein [Nitrospirota bacterium]
MHIQYKKIMFVVSILIALLPGCTYLLGPDEGGGPVSAGSATNPYVVFTHPSNGQVSVARTGSFMVQVEFNMDMNPSSVTFSMTTSGSTVSGSVYWNGSKMLQFIPHSTLLPNSTYECSISAAKSTSGYSLTPLPFSWKFTTGF